MIIGIGIDLAEVERYQFDEVQRARFARPVDAMDWAEPVEGAAPDDKPAHH